MRIRRWPMVIGTTVLFGAAAVACDSTSSSEPFVSTSGAPTELNELEETDSSEEADTGESSELSAEEGGEVAAEEGGEAAAEEGGEAAAEEGGEAAAEEGGEAGEEGGEEELPQIGDKCDGDPFGGEAGVCAGDPPEPVLICSGGVYEDAANFNDLCFCEDMDGDGKADEVVCLSPGFVGIERSGRKRVATRRLRRV